LSYLTLTSAKNFQPPVKDSGTAARWLRILTADLASRVAEDEDGRLPKTITIHHRSGGTTKSRQGPLPSAKTMNKEFLFMQAMSVWRGIEAEGRAFPANTVSIGLSGFGDVEEGIQDIQGFLVPQQTSQLLRNSSGSGTSSGESPSKRKRTYEGITKFFIKKEMSISGQFETDTADVSHFDYEDETYLCTKCQKRVPLEEVETHEDYHLALELSRGSPIRVEPSPRVKGSSHSTEEKRGKKIRAVEKGQKRLDFGVK
jgi:DNA polymerase eta